MGNLVGILVGNLVGNLVGKVVAPFMGCSVGDTLGTLVGKGVGSLVGCSVGLVCPGHGSLSEYCGMDVRIHSSPVAAFVCIILLWFQVSRVMRCRILARGKDSSPSDCNTAPAQKSAF